MSETNARVAVVQDGARRNYAVPLVLHRAGALERMFTEWYVKPRSVASIAAGVASKVRPKIGARMRQRRHPELDAAKVFTNLPLAFHQSRARQRFATLEDFFAWSSDRVGEWIARKGFGGANVLFGFVRNVSPALCELTRERGLAVVADQIIAPMVEENRQAVLQQQRFPEWQRTAEPCNPDIVQSVESRTWKCAHEIICGSDYVRKCLIAEGVRAERITVLPFPIDVSRFKFVDRVGRPGPITVGVVGTLGLRKGTPYFLQVAKRLPAVQFSLVGPVSVDVKLLDGLANLKVVGPVSRGEIPGELAKFDVLLFPSTCEGSPGAVMEAMATGLPIVTAPTAGTAVRHDVDGFVHPYDDVEAMAHSVEKLATDASLRAEMGQAARRRAESFDLNGYGQSVVNVCRRALSEGGSQSAAS